MVRRGDDRAVTRHEGCEARHGFSFGTHYDPANTFFGALLAHNDERLEPGAGYPTHTHHEADLVTWVVAGELRHTDSLGNAVTVRPGTVQVLAAGTGVEHAEYGPARFVQSWLVPDALAEPTLHSRDVSGALATGRPVLVAAGALPQGQAVDPLPLRRADAALWAARLSAGGTWELPSAPFVHVYVTTGSTGELGEGDELRLTATPFTLTAGARGAEVLVWVMGSDLRPA